MVIASRNNSRSSALSIASAVAPIISTSYLFEHAHLLQRQRAIERRLAAHGRQQREAAGDGVALLGDDLGDDLGRDRLDIGAVRHVRIGHDRGGIGIDQDDAVALGAQRLAGLGAGIVELAGLPDDDRPGADDQDGRNVGPLRHPVLWARARRPLGGRRAKKGRAAASGREASSSEGPWPPRAPARRPPALVDEIPGLGKGRAAGCGDPKACPPSLSRRPAATR